MLVGGPVLSPELEHGGSSPGRGIRRSEQRPSPGSGEAQASRNEGTVKGPLGSQGRQDAARLDHRGAVECPWAVDGDLLPCGKSRRGG